jgi:hypothetical protein
MPDVLPPVERPNGKMYRPKKIVARLLDDRNGDRDSMVLVTGTHDIEFATTLASGLVSDWIGKEYRPVYSGCGWWRDGMENGEQCWVDDDVRGSAGVMFGRIEEVPSPAQEDADRFNRDHPAGTPVTYWPGAREGDGRQGVTRSAARVICGSACVWIEGVPAGMALTHVEVREQASA